MAQAFQREVSVLVSTILTKTDEWDKRTSAVIQLQGLMEANRGNAAVFNAELWRTLKEPLQYILQDLRSGLLREACKFLEILSEASGNAMAPLMHDLLPEFFLGVGCATPVIKNYFDYCMQHVITYTRFPREIPHIAEKALKSKSAPIREAMSLYIALMLQQWPTKAMESNVSSLEAAVTALLEDASPGARERARDAFRHFETHWPQRAAQIKDRVRPQTAKLLSDDASSAANGGGGGGGGGGGESFNNVGSNGSVAASVASSSRPGTSSRLAAAGAAASAGKRPATGIPRLGSGREQKAGAPRPPSASASASTSDRVIKGGGGGGASSSNSTGKQVANWRTAAAAAAGSDDTEQSAAAGTAAAAAGATALETSLLTSRGSNYSFTSVASTAALKGPATPGTVTDVAVSPPRANGGSGIAGSGIRRAPKASPAHRALSPTQSVDEGASVGDALPAINQRVFYTFREADRGRHEATVRFVGKVQYASGLRAGIEFAEPIGRNDGLLNGVSYFRCLPSHGLFVRPEALEWDCHTPAKGESDENSTVATEAVADQSLAEPLAEAPPAAALGEELLRAHKADLAELMHIAGQEVNLITEFEKACLGSTGGERRPLSGSDVRMYLGALTEVVGHREVMLAAMRERIEETKARCDELSARDEQGS